MASSIRELAHLQIPLQKILDATNNFSDKNIIGTGGFGNVYRGKLERHGKMIKVTARRLDRKYGQGDVEFWTEVSMLYSLRDESDKNRIVNMIGFCDQKGEKIIVSGHYPKGSLSMYISDPTLTWTKRLSIAMTVCWGILHIHTNLEGDYIIHRNINSSTILLDEKWHPRLSGFEFSIKHSQERRNEVVISEAIGTRGYIDPAIEKYGGVNHKSDIYSVGVVLFELLCGRKAFEENRLLAPLAKFHYEKGTLKDIIHPDIWNQMNPKSFKSFSKAAYSCLQEDPTLRPDANKLWNKVMEVYLFQGQQGEMQQKKHPIFENVLDRSSWKENHKDPLRISFNDIKLATQDFDRANCIGGGGFGLVYKGKLAHGKVNGHPTIVAKKLDKSQGQGDKHYYNELEILYEYNHENVISLIGFSNETDEKLIVYEHASKGSLDKHLNNASLTWRNRLKICIDVATGLNFLHESIQGHGVVIHRDIKTANILLFDDWKAKIGDFGLSLRSTTNKATNFTINHPCGTKDYVDPMYLKSGILTVKSDVYSLGVTLFEILCGRATYTIPKHKSQSLLSFIKHNFEDGKQDEVVFKAIKKEIVPKSLTTFLNVVYKCLDDDREKRPTTKEVLAQLEKALEFQDENKV